MKRKSLILFLIVTITVLSMSAINRTYAKYKFTVQNDINISNEHYRNIDKAGMGKLIQG